MRLTPLAVGLISSAAATALLAPVASGTTPTGQAAVSSKPSAVASQRSPAVLPSVPGKQLIVVETALAGMAHPAAPAPVVVAVDRSSIAQFGRHEVKEGYVNVEQKAWQRAGQDAGTNAVIGAIAGAIIGAIFGLPFLIVGAIPGAFFGAITGAISGAIWGAVAGYIYGRNAAIAHNNAVKKNGGKPVSARVKVTAPAPVTVDGVVRQAQTTVDSFARQAHRELRKAPTVKLPPSAHRSIDNAKREFARVFGIPTPKR